MVDILRTMSSTLTLRVNLKPVSNGADINLAILIVYILHIRATLAGKGHTHRIKILPFVVSSLDPSTSSSFLILAWYQNMGCICE